MIPDKPQEKGRWKALAFTALMHLVLLAVLFFGVQWKRNAPVAVDVELWSNRPPAPATVTPPPPPPPPPEPEKPLPKVEPKPEPKPPVKPDIALKEEKKKPKPEPEPKKPEPKKPEPKPEVKKPEAQPKPLPSFEQQLREDALQRNAEAAAREQRAGSQKQRGLADWIGKIQGKIRGNMVQPANIQGNPEAVFRVNLLPSGEVLQPIRLVKSSGHPGLDAAIERAILKSSPLPKPADPAVFQRDLEIKYRPFEE